MFPVIKPKIYEFSLSIKRKQRLCNMYIFMMQILLPVFPAKPTRVVAEERNN